MNEYKKQHSFIITFDFDTEEWIQDCSSEEAKMDNRTIYCPETNEWTSGYKGDGKYEPYVDWVQAELDSII